MKTAIPRQAPDDRALSEPSLFQLDYIAVPGDLIDYVTTFYHFRCDEKNARDIQPAAVGHLTIFPCGTGNMLFQDGRSDPANEVNLLTPSTEAATIELEGPFHAVGAALTPLGWAALTGMDADLCANRLLPAEKYLGLDIGETGRALAHEYRSRDADAQAIVAALAAYIRENLKPVNPRHAKLIEQTNRWLSSAIDPAIDDLFEAADYSRRQVQRLVERYFGLAPRSLQRKYRALRAAAFLSLPQLTPEIEAEIANAFYDQSHMIREIQLFAGRTPARLADDENPFLSEMLNMRNFREIG